MVTTTMSREIDSTLTTLQIDKDLARRADRVHSAIGRAPTLSLMWVNPEHKPSEEYVGYKTRVAERLGIAVRPWNHANADGLFDQIWRDNEDPNIDGIITQLPFSSPDKPKESAILAAIAPDKDVDGLGPQPGYGSATGSAIVRLLRDNGINYHTQPVGVGGLGRLAGGPVVSLLKESGAKDVKAFNIQTDPLQRIAILNRPIFISAMGDPGVLTPDLFLPGANRVIIDAGTTEQKGEVLGDVHPSMREYAAEHDIRITALKNALGPLTIRMLLANTVQSAERHAGLPTPFVAPYISTSLPAQHSS